MTVKVFAVIVRVHQPKIQQTIVTSSVEERRLRMIQIQLSEDRLMLLGQYHDLAKAREALLIEDRIDLELLRKAPAKTQGELDITKRIRQRVETIANLSKQLDLLQHKIGDLQQIELVLNTQAVVSSLQQQQAPQQQGACEADNADPLDVLLQKAAEDRSAQPIDLSEFVGSLHIDKIIEVEYETYPGAELIKN